MATIIEPGNRKPWQEVIRIKDESEWAIVNDCLFVTAAHMTRGGKKPTKALYGQILYAVAELYDPDYVGKFAYYLRLVFEAKPIAYREYGVAATA